MTSRSLLIIGLALAVNSCELTQTDMNWEIISGGQGEWNIDELRITHVFNGTVTTDTTIYNNGIITFSGTEDEPEFQFEKAIPLKSFDLGPISGPLGLFGTDLFFDLNTGTGISANFIDAEIIKIEKKEIILFCPWSLNTIIDVNEDVDFYLKLSRK